MRKTVIGIISAVVLVALFLVLCTFRARPYEMVVVVRFGAIVPTPGRIAYNWYLCYPTDKVVRLDSRLHVYPSDLIEMPMSGEPINVRTFTAWRIKDPALFYRKFEDNDTEATKFLNNEVRAATQDVLARHKFDQIFNASAAATAPTDDHGSAGVQTKQIEEEIMARVNTNMRPSVTKDGEHHDGVGMEVVEVGFSRFAFALSASEKIYTRMSAERERLAQRYIDEGKTEAAKIAADGDAQAAVIVGQAKRQAEVIKSQAEKEALDIIAEMQEKPYAKDLYEFWRSLELFKSAIKPGTVMILTAADPILRGFHGPTLVPPPPATQPGTP